MTKEKLIEILTFTPLPYGFMIGYFLPIGEPTFNKWVDIGLFLLGVGLTFSFFYLKFHNKNK